MLVQFLISLSAALLAFALIRGLPRPVRPAPLRPEDGPEPVILLFHDHRLIDATGPARTLLAAIPGDSEWQRLSGWLAARLPAAGLAEIGRSPRLELAGADGLHLLAEDLGEGHLRLTLADPGAENAGILVDSLTLTAMEHELRILRSTMDHSPMLAWRQDAGGSVTWANSAYLQMAEQAHADETLWPLPRLVDLDAGPAPGGSGARRVQVRNDSQGRWYDCHVHDFADQTVAIALPADATVRAERSLREFVQTLTKTFADLPTGLAIFDRDRKLQLFNPALIDLTGLATGFLTARPTLFAFLDRLREARMVPEPKDYRSWREQMSSLVAAASSGRHVETWSLPAGQTYRVTGRPHPDGAVAFLFEDITSEILLTRKFRADILLASDVLDSLEDAIAVFAGNGQILLSNRRYTEIWAEIWTGPPHSTIDDQLAQWGESCGDSPGLAALRRALSLPLPATGQHGAIAGPQGGLLSWRLRPLTAGRLLLKFRPAVDMTSADLPGDSSVGDPGTEIPQVAAG